jgi:hypothetical protein
MTKIHKEVELIEQRKVRSLKTMELYSQGEKGNGFDDTNKEAGWI